jgi:hypothetical protein
MPSQMSEEEIRKLAESRVSRKKGFFIHLIVYIVVNSFLVIIWAITSSVAKFWFPWFIFPLAGWGVGLLFHGMSVFAFPQGGSDWERKEIEKEMDKLRKGS